MSVQNQTNLGIGDKRDVQDWLPNVTYQPNEEVSNDFNVYICLVCHIATSSFANDLASGYWKSVAPPADTIYTADGSLDSNRTVDLNGFNLFFDNGLDSILRLYSDGRFELGLNASTFDSTSVAIGDGATSSNILGVAIGLDALANQVGSVAIGDTAVDNPTGGAGTAIGRDATNTGNFGFALGRNSNNSGAAGISFGNQNTNSGDRAVSIGSGANVTGTEAVGIGSQVESTTTRAISIGNEITNPSIESIALGSFITTSNSRAIVLGSGADSTNVMTTSLDNSFSVGWDVINPHILLSESGENYFNLSGNIFIGDGSADANEGAPNNIPASISKLTVLGDAETSDGIVLTDRDDGLRYRYYSEFGVLNVELV